MARNLSSDVLELGQLFAAAGHEDTSGFPVRGADLVALGMSPGPDVGFALDKLKQVWKDSGYQMGKDALIASLYTED